MLLVSGSSNSQLASNIANHLGVDEINIEISRFDNGEKRIWITESVQGENVILVQSFSEPVDEHIVETLLITDALERGGARHVNLVIPWLGYSLQDKVFRPGEPIAATVVANVISHAYVKRVFLLDLHNSSTPGFFRVPSQHLSAHGLFAQYIRDKIGTDNTVIASPDFGGLKRARQFADELELDLVNIDKHRDLESGEVTAVGLSGHVTGKTAILLDDAILSGGTAIEAARLLMAEGAAETHFFATHGIFNNDALQHLAASSLEKIVITDSIAHPNLPDKITQLDTAPLFADELRTWL